MRLKGSSRRRLGNEQGWVWTGTWRAVVSVEEGVGSRGMIFPLSRLRRHAFRRFVLVAGAWGDARVYMLRARPSFVTRIT